MMFFDESKHPRDEDGKFTEKGGSSHGENKIPSMKKVDLKDFINYDEDYLTSSGGSGRIRTQKNGLYYDNQGQVADKLPSLSDPERAKAKLFLKNNDYPDKDFLKIVDSANIEGYETLDLKTGKAVDPPLTDGYMVSFQVNKELGKHRDYTSDDYDDYIYEMINRTGSKPYLGTYGNAEISFHVKDKKLAMQLAKEYNQASIYDIASNNGEGDVIPNPFYNYDTNPTGGD